MWTVYTCRNSFIFILQTLQHTEAYMHVSSLLFIINTAASEAFLKNTHLDVILICQYTKILVCCGFQCPTTLVKMSFHLCH